MTEVAATAGVRGEAADPAYVITLATSHVGNRLGVADMLAFIGHLERAHDAAAPVLVVRAAGPDFCLGRLQGESVPGTSRLESLRLILRANSLLRSFAGVSVALVRGRAFGFGAGTALQCDLTLAAEDATFAFDEVRHGLAPLVVAEYLPGYVGHKRALRLILTGAELSAAQALRDGLVTELVAADRFDDAAEQLLAGLGAAPPGALRLMKRYVAAVRAHELADPQDAAVVWLDDWLTDGAPEYPGV